MGGSSHAQLSISQPQLRIFRQLKQLASHMSSFVSGKYIYFFSMKFSITSISVCRMLDKATSQVYKSRKLHFTPERCELWDKEQTILLQN